MPTMPQNAAGSLTDPPVSDPMPPSTSPAATAAAVPLLDPAVLRAVSQGLRAAGQGRSGSGPAKACSWQASLPSMTMPATARSAAAAASLRSSQPANWREQPVVAMPAVAKMSLCAMGMPSSGPRSVPAIARASAARASARARDCVTSVKACSVPSWAQMRASMCCVSSTGDSMRAAMARAASWIVGVTRRPRRRTGAPDAAPAGKGAWTSWSMRSKAS